MSEELLVRVRALKDNLAKAGVHDPEGLKEIIAVMASDKVVALVKSTFVDLDLASLIKAYEHLEAIIKAESDPDPVDFNDQGMPSRTKKSKSKKH